MRRFIDRLWPARLRQRAELSGEQRRGDWARVPDGDPGLRATLDVLGDMVEGNLGVAFNPDEPVEKRLRACERAGIAVGVLRQIEEEREQAKAWQQERDQG